MFLVTIYDNTDKKKKKKYGPRTNKVPGPEYKKLEGKYRYINYPIDVLNNIKKKKKNIIEVIKII